MGRSCGDLHAGGGGLSYEVSRPAEEPPSTGTRYNPNTAIPPHVLMCSVSSHIEILQAKQQVALQDKVRKQQNCAAWPICRFKPLQHEALQEEREAEEQKRKWMISPEGMLHPNTAIPPHVLMCSVSSHIEILQARQQVALQDKVRKQQNCAAWLICKFKPLQHEALQEGQEVEEQKDKALQQYYGGGAGGGGRWAGGGGAGGGGRWTGGGGGGGGRWTGGGGGGGGRWTGGGGGGGWGGGWGGDGGGSGGGEGEELWVG